MQSGRPGGIGSFGYDRRQHLALGCGEHGSVAAGPGQLLGVGGVVEPKAAADPEGQSGGLGRDMAANHAGKAVQVADAEPGQA